MLEKSKEVMAKQYDKYHINKSFRIGDEVYLQAKNIKTIRPNVKLDHQQLGPFTIINTVGKQSYKLQLPPLYGQLHPTFHVSLLEPYYRQEGEVQNLPEIPIDGEDTPKWEIESIVADQRQYQKRQYLVKWKGYSPAEATWEPLVHVKNTTALSDYLQEKKTKQEQIIPEDKTPPISNDKVENTEDTPLDRGRVQQSLRHGNTTVHSKNNKERIYLK